MTATRCEVCPARARVSMLVVGEAWVFCRHHALQVRDGIAQRLLADVRPYGPFVEELAHAS